jgi:hypothetical protein
MEVQEMLNRGMSNESKSVCLGWRATYLVVTGCYNALAVRPTNK